MVSGIFHATRVTRQATINGSLSGSCVTTKCCCRCARRQVTHHRTRPHRNLAGGSKTRRNKNEHRRAYSKPRGREGKTEETAVASSYEYSPQVMSTRLAVSTSQTLHCTPTPVVSLCNDWSEHPERESTANEGEFEVVRDVGVRTF